MYDILWVALTLAVAWLLWSMCPRMYSIHSIGARVPEDYQPVIVSTCRWLIGLVAVIILMRIFGFSAGHVLASLSAFALVAAVAFFAYWSVLSNGLCSLLLYLFQPFRIGDWIEMRENENNIVAAGKVVGINLIYVTLVFADNKGVENQFQIPTNLMFQRTIRVLRGENTRRLGRRAAEPQGEKASSPPVQATAAKAKTAPRAKAKPRPKAAPADTAKSSSRRKPAPGIGGAD